MDNNQVSGKIFSIFEPEWCQEHIFSASLLLNKNKLTKSDILALKQDFETYFVQYRTFDNNSEEKVNKLQKAIMELNEMAHSIDSIEKKESENESEAKRSLIVCSSSVFKKEEKSGSNWNSENIVGLDFSFSKSYQISPDIRRGSNESEVSALSLVYKWKGLKSNVNPLSIPIHSKELPQYLQAGVIMFSIFDPAERGFPVSPIDPSSCKEVLQKVENWTTLGGSILESFGLTAENVGSLLQKHLHDIAFSSQEIHQDMEGTKSLKKKIAEEHMADLWSKRKKAFVKSIEKNSN